MTTIKPFTTTYTIKGHKYQVTSDAKFDDHGKIIADKELDDVATNKAHSMFRKDQGYFFPQDLKKFRSKLHFTQKDLANLLGMSPNTIAMYELGAIPSEANNKLLQLIMSDDKNLKETAKGKNISPCVKRKVEKYFSSQELSYDNYDLDSPFTAIQLANWIIVQHHMDEKMDSNIEPLTQMKLIKLLYLAYGIFLAQTKHKLFSSDIRHYQWGPLIMEVHQQFSHQRIISDDLSEQAYEDFINVSANIPITELLKFVLKKYDKYTAAYLSKLTHQKDSPWSKTPNHATIKDKLIYDAFSNGNEM